SSRGSFCSKRPDSQVVFLVQASFHPRSGFDSLVPLLLKRQPSPLGVMFAIRFIDQNGVCPAAVGIDASDHLRTSQNGKPTPAHLAARWTRSASFPSLSTWTASIVDPGAPQRPL